MSCWIGPPCPDWTVVSVGRRTPRSLRNLHDCMTGQCEAMPCRTGSMEDEMDVPVLRTVDRSLSGQTTGSDHGHRAVSLPSVGSHWFREDPMGSSKGAVNMQTGLEVTASIVDPVMFDVTAFFFFFPFFFASLNCMQGG